ncbi:MAG: DUF3253 domain-containing protein, partial [Candidatus Dormibacteria bacterium]
MPATLPEADLASKPEHRYDARGPGEGSARFRSFSACRPVQAQPRMPQHLPDDELAQRISDCVLELLTARGPGRTLCPSEIALVLAGRIGYDWQELMRPVRTVAAALADAGAIEALQHEAVVDIREARGPIRL